MNWRFPILLACCALASAAAETAAERGKRVVYEALQALGGDAFCACKTGWRAGGGMGFTANRSLAWR